MTREDAEEVLQKAGKAGDDAFPLFEAALACAIHDDDSRDAQSARHLAEEGVRHLRERLTIESPEEALAEAMSGDLGLSGDLMTQNHPENADVLGVCARRKGLPAALGIYYLHAARLCGLQVNGVDADAIDRNHFQIGAGLDHGAVGAELALRRALLDPTSASSFALSAASK